MAVVVAVLLTAVAVPSLAARAAGGGAPSPLPQLAAFAPVATLPAVAGVALAASASWWLALLLAVPAAPMLAWQAPVRTRPGQSRCSQRRPGQLRGREVPPAPVPRSRALSLRVLTLNVQSGSAAPEAVVRGLDLHEVDVLAVQELTPEMVDGLAAAGVADRLGFCHLDPRAGSAGTGLWARWPMAALPPLPGMWAAAPRARIDPWGAGPVTLTAVHLVAPLNAHVDRWQQELALIRAAFDDGGALHVLAGDFNASRDHRPFREVLAAGFVDCADAASKRPWPGFTWPAGRMIPPVMRLDHILVSGTGIGVRESRVVRVGRTDHRGVLAALDLTVPGPVPES